MLKIDESFVNIDNKVNQITSPSFPVINRIEKLNTSIILYCLLQKNRALFFQNDEGILYYLEEIVDTQKGILEKMRFFSINRYYYVNVEHVVRIVSYEKKNYCELTNGELLQISKNKVREFQKVLNSLDVNSYN